LSKILPSSGLGPGLDKVGQRGQKYSTYDISHKKTKPQIFFIADSKTCQVFWGFELL